MHAIRIRFGSSHPARPTIHEASSRYSDAPRTISHGPADEHVHRLISYIGAIWNRIASPPRRSCKHRESSYRLAIACRHRIPSHHQRKPDDSIASHCIVGASSTTSIASHRGHCGAHRIASHRIASHLIAWAGGDHVRRLVKIPTWTPRRTSELKPQNYVDVESPAASIASASPLPCRSSGSIGTEIIVSHRIVGLQPPHRLPSDRRSGAVGQASHRIASSVDRGVIVSHRIAGAALSHRIASFWAAQALDDES
jgi:hypothetical protein